MTSPRYLIVDISGGVSGTNDHDSLPNIATDENVSVIIDTLENTYSNEDYNDVDVEDFEPRADDTKEGDEASLDGIGGGGAKDPV